MKTPKHSLRKIVNFLNNPDEDGGFWLPNIQRPFVWSEEQTCRLFDSILREYPISTLLVWKTRSKIRRRKFIDNFRPEHRTQLASFYVPEDDKKKCLVLDGQQRLQSLFIGLKGSYEGRELFLDMLSGEVAAPDDVKFRFAFRDTRSSGFPWVKFKELVFSDLDPFSAGEDVVSKAGRALSDEERRKVSRHVALIFKTFHGDDGIGYQELDSTENQSLYTEDDVVEVFIRANSGGTKLGKSDLLFSLLASTWDDADEQMESLLEDLNRRGFAFTRDFMLKTCLTLLGHGARYEVEKFRKPGVRKEIEEKWEAISDATMAVADFVVGKTYVRCDKALPSYLVLIPLIYFRFHEPDAWRSARDLDGYLLRSSLAGAFSGTPDQLIDDIVRDINARHAFDVPAVFEVIRSKNRSLELTESRLWGMGYGSDAIHLLFNLWYREFNYAPAFDGNMPQVDHIFPQSILRREKVVNPITGRRDRIRYRDTERNQLANCMLLTAEENGAGGKGDTPPDRWFVGSRAEDGYLDMHLIPKDPALWRLDRFTDFIEARKLLIRKKLGGLLAGTVSPSGTGVTVSPAELSEQGEEDTGYWFMNSGDTAAHRECAWEDCRKYGFMRAGGAETYREDLRKLAVGDRLFAFLSGHGYVGLGEVTAAAVPLEDFVPSGQDRPLHKLPLEIPFQEAQISDAEKFDLCVGVRWIKAVGRGAAVLRNRSRMGTLSRIRQPDLASELLRHFDPRG